MKTIQKGFTLIELMIVIAIIGILAAIAIPQYQNYVAQSQMSAGLSEIAGGKTGYELLVNKGDQPAGPGDIGLQTTTDRCDIAVNTYDSSTGANTGNYAIQCAVKGNPAVSGTQINLQRTADGEYDCVLANKPTGYDTSYDPEGCS